MARCTEGLKILGGVSLAGRNMVDVRGWLAADEAVLSLRLEHVLSLLWRKTRLVELADEEVRLFPPKRGQNIFPVG